MASHPEIEVVAKGSASVGVDGGHNVLPQSEINIEEGQEEVHEHPPEGGGHLPGGGGNPAGGEESLPKWQTAFCNGFVTTILVRLAMANSYLMGQSLFTAGLWALLGQVCSQFLSDIVMEVLSHRQSVWRFLLTAASNAFVSILAGGITWLSTVLISQSRHSYFTFAPTWVVVLAFIIVLYRLGLSRRRVSSRRRQFFWKFVMFLMFILAVMASMWVIQNQSAHE